MKKKFETYNFREKTVTKNQFKLFKTSMVLKSRSFMKSTFHHFPNISSIEIPLTKNLKTPSPTPKSENCSCFSVLLFRSLTDFMDD